MKSKYFILMMLALLMSSHAMAMAMLTTGTPAKPEIQCPVKVELTAPVCEREFSPVCALIKVGKERFRRMTYSSKCLACNSAKVVSYSVGPCR